MKCKIEKELFDSLYSQGLNDPAIAKSLGVSVSTVLRFRKMHNYPANKIQHLSQRAKAIEIKQEVREVLCGTLLGDSSLQYTGIKAISPLFSSYHGPQQEEYIKHLAEVLKDFNPNCKKRERFDKRTQKTYICWSIVTKANPEFIPLYNNLYINGKKQITKEFLKDFTLKSLAYLYMDDGYYCRNTAFICTDCFDEESLQNFKEHCESNFNLRFGFEKHGKGIRMRLKTADFKLFQYLINPYVINSLKYKLNLSPNPVNLGKPS